MKKKIESTYNENKIRGNFLRSQKRTKSNLAEQIWAGDRLKKNTFALPETSLSRYNARPIMSPP